MAISKIETASLDTGLVAPTATALTTASGSAPSYSARAWVNFNGTGTVAIRASGNVSSITDNGTGLYTVNFTTALPDANYSILGTAQSLANLYGVHIYGTAANPFVGTTTSCPIAVSADTGSKVDSGAICVAVFR
jgi:hypothetical protein